MAKAVSYSRDAVKALRRMPANTAELIVSKIDLYAENPAALANHVKALRGSDAIRLRVGDWRVIMVDGVVLLIVRIVARGGAYQE